MNEFKDEIDWNVFNKQQNVPKQPYQQPESQEPESKYYSNMPMGKPKEEMVNTAFGKLPRNMHEYKLGSPENKNLLSEMINAGVGAPGMNVIGGAARTGAAKIAENLLPHNLPATTRQGIQTATDYMQPNKAAEAFRKTIGEGTTTENIAELGQRVKYAKGSAREEALIPKRELYKTEGRKDVYKVGEENLPEGNLNKLSEMIDSGNKFTESQGKALSTVLKQYRKSGDISHFLENSEDIFHLEALPKNAEEKIVDTLLIPTERESAYFADKEVTDFYGKKGKLNSLHKAYEQKPTLTNADKLSSALKEEERKLAAREKSKTITDIAEEKLGQLRSNIKNLESDVKGFVENLPEKMQGLEKEWRTKYAQGVGKYESAPLTMRKLAEGRWSEVSGDQVAKLFTKPTKETMQILKDLGPSAAKNILYNALQKVPLNDAEGMANTILDLKRTKGYDTFVTPEMEKWANSMLKQIRYGGAIKKGLTSVGGIAAGSALFGPMGGAVGLTAPWLWKGGKIIAEKLRK